MKHPVVSTQDYTIFFEDIWFGPIVHMDVYSRWTKTLKAEVFDVLTRLVRRWGPLHVAYFEDQGPKQKKLLKMMGFVPHCTRIRMNGERVPFYIRVL